MSLVRKKPITSKKTDQAKEQLIQRLLAKAALDFKCCGHGKCTTN